MSVRLIEGFDACTDANKYLGKWTSTGSITNIYASGGRFNSGYIALTSYSFFRTFDSQPTWVVGFARLAVTNIYATDILTLEDGGTQQIVVRTNSAGAIAIDRGSTQIAISNAGILMADTWFFIEVKATIADSGGAVQVRVNGVVVVSVTNADTKASANASANVIRFGGGGSNTARYDDIYILDGTGATLNDFLGDHRVRTLLPAADDVVQFARSTGSYNYANVDDASSDEDTTYNESSTVGAKDFFAFNDLPANPGTITCVQVSARARKNDAGERSLRTKVKSDGTEANGATNALGSTYLYSAEVFATDPATGAAWTETAVNAAGYGYEVL